MGRIRGSRRHRDTQTGGQGTRPDLTLKLGVPLAALVPRVRNGLAGHGTAPRKNGQERESAARKARSRVLGVHGTLLHLAHNVFSHRVQRRALFAQAEQRIMELLARLQLPFTEPALARGVREGVDRLVSRLRREDSYASRSRNNGAHRQRREKPAIGQARKRVVEPRLQVPVGFREHPVPRHLRDAGRQILFQVLRLLLLAPRVNHPDASTYRSTGQSDLREPADRFHPVHLLGLHGFHGLGCSSVDDKISTLTGANTNEPGQLILGATGNHGIPRLLPKEVGHDGRKVHGLVAQARHRGALPHLLEVLLDGPAIDGLCACQLLVGRSILRLRSHAVRLLPALRLREVRPVFADGDPRAGKLRHHRRNARCRFRRRHRLKEVLKRSND